MYPEAAKKLEAVSIEPQKQEAETAPVEPIPLTRERVKEVVEKHPKKSILKKATDFFDIPIKPDILDGNQYEAVNSYRLKNGEKVTACLKAGEHMINSNVVMVDPANNSFAVIQGVGELGEQRIAAREYAKAFEKYKNPFRGQVEAEKEISTHGIHAQASYMYGKIIKNEGKKYFQARGLGDDVFYAVYDKSGVDKTNPDPDDMIPVEKGDRILVMSRQMGLTPDDIYGFMLKPGSFSLKSVNDVANEIRKATADKPVDQAFVLMEIR